MNLRVLKLSFSSKYCFIFESVSLFKTRFLISELEGTTQNSRTTAAELDAQLISLLKDLEVELIILDEIQNIASSYDGIEFQRII